MARARVGPEQSNTAVPTAAAAAAAAAATPETNDSIALAAKANRNETHDNHRQLQFPRARLPNMLPTRLLRAAHGPKPNITGFNMRHLKASSGQPKYDPWERAEAWRYEGPFTRWNRFKGGLPGLGTASIAFAGYCAYEHFFMEDEHHHGEGHGESGH